MKETKAILGSIALLAILLLGARSANASGAPSLYMVFSFTLTTYIQQETNLNDPPGSLTYKGTTFKSKVTTSNVVQTLGMVSGCAANQPGGVLPVGTQIGIFLGDDSGNVFFLNSDYTRVPNCDPVSPEFFGITQFDGIEVISYTLMDIPKGSLKKQSWGHMGFQILAGPANWMTLSGLAAERYNQFYSTGKITRTVKIPVSGRGKLDANAAVFFGTISSKLVFAP